ncbi:hypothetical protein DV736_g2683, partial [Chaetothyriales sp. CBS 134916]
MSGRRRLPGDNSSSYSIEPIIIERRPKDRSRSPVRRRKVTFSLNPFKSRRKDSIVIKETTVRRRRTVHRSRTPSPASSPPRGPDHAMDPRLGDSYVPLPKKLPRKDDKSLSSDSDHQNPKKGKEKSCRRKVNIVQSYDPEDASVYPVVNSPLSSHSPASHSLASHSPASHSLASHSPASHSPASHSPASRGSHRRRDSGFSSVEGTPRRRYFDSHGRVTYSPAVTDQHIQSLSTKLHEVQLEKYEMKEEMLKAREEAVEAKEELQRERRRSQLERRERDVADRERQQREHQRRISDVRHPTARPPRDVVIRQPDPPARTGANAHNRAKEDFLKKRYTSDYR